MFRSLTPWRYAAVALVVGLFVLLGSDRAADINPAYVSFKLPNQIEWTRSATGSLTAVLVGDPNKPGLYVVLNKWAPGQMSRPHYHQNDRYITVISGTWWKGTGTKFDPPSTVPFPAGSFVTDIAKGIHYDGAKDQECVLEIVGIGPAAAIPAEEK